MINPTNPDFDNTPVSSSRPTFGYLPSDPHNPPVVSILTPFYNTNELFHETAQSVMKQSLQQWEWIIVNDGSTDPKALQILDHYRNFDPRIRVIDSEKNIGCSSARNIGFENARSGLVLPIDSDDLLEPTAAEKWLWFLDSFPEYSFVRGLNVGFGAKEYLWEKGFHLGSEMLERNLLNPTSIIRKQVHQAVGGFDETMLEGLEDWDFWLRCADVGYWGATVFEYLDWYRTRPDHSDRWPNFNEKGIAKFRKTIPHKFPNLTKKTFPNIRPRFRGEFAKISDQIPCDNILQKNKPRLLMIVPWLRVGGADQFNFHLLEYLTNAGWEVSIVSTLGDYHPWMSKFSQITPDIFILPKFLRIIDYPRFLRYLIGSRNPDIVMVTNSEFGYFSLPYLRSYFPDIPFVDYNHMEEEYWKNGSHPRAGVEYQYWLDRSIVASNHLKNWMVRRGAKEENIDVCYINVDTQKFKPDKQIRKKLRDQLGIPDQTKVLIYVGRITEQKQPKVFAETVLKLKNAGTDFCAIAIGDGPDLPWLRSFVDHHNLNQSVICTGEIANEEVKSYLNAADILFLPSKWEGIALTIYEAMACGLAIVGADVGGQKELVSNEVGILVDIKNVPPAKQPEIYAALLDDLIANPDQIEEMKEAARTRVVKHFALPEMGKNMLEIFEKTKETHHANKDTKVYLKEYGYALSVLANEYTRIFISADSSFVNIGPVDQMIMHLNWKKFLYLSIRKVFFHFYSRFETRIKWLPRFKDWLKTRMEG